MERKKLYMIGNSHIDPVWFWDWDEGMQEVKATFSSALDRMKEYPLMKFTATSTAFLEWIEEIAPELFEEIKIRVQEGRFLLGGGWFLEPDCILPCGEAFVRQGLYGQRYLQKAFGKTSSIGSNVDSFGHNPVLPQILKKSRMDTYVFMRPRLDTPVFYWESLDESRVLAISLPSEYTTWFYESTREAVLMAAAAAGKAGLHGMPCCYGVGNHGGGPTKKNIESIYTLQQEIPQLELEFSGYPAFIEEMTKEEQAGLSIRKGYLDKVNTGCYSMDSELKKKNREAEKRLRTADMMAAMEGRFCRTYKDRKKELQRLWKILLFNQFHDTLGGTASKPARDEALLQLSGVCAESKKIWTLAMQNMVREVDTTGEGFPLFLFNPTGEDYEGPVEAELNWFCKDGLILKDEKGNEVPYQRAYTQAKVRNYNLGGRRALVFEAGIPAGGFVIYRTVIGEPALCCDIRRKPEFPLACNPDYKPEEDPHILENASIRAAFNQRGYLCSLFDKEEGYEALTGPVHFPIWLDERDTWGGLQNTRFEDSGEELEFERLELVECGSIRKVVRAVYRHGGSRLTQLYILYRHAKALEVRSSLFWDKEWKMLKVAFPVKELKRVVAECAYGTAEKERTDADEYCMHRFLDGEEASGAGICIANDGKYVYQWHEGCLQLPVARSAIFCQGNGKNWYEPLEGYTYADQGSQEFTLLLRPHGATLGMKARYRLASLAEKSCLVLGDNLHEGERKETRYQMFSCREENVEIAAVKQAEEGEALILRLLETEGKDTEGILTLDGREHFFSIGHHEILTLRADGKTGELQEVNLLEEGEKDGTVSG